MLNFCPLYIRYIYNDFCGFYYMLAFCVLVFCRSVFLRYVEEIFAT